MCEVREHISFSTKGHRGNFSANRSPYFSGDIGVCITRNSKGRFSVLLGHRSDYATELKVLLNTDEVRTPQRVMNLLSSYIGPNWRDFVIYKNLHNLPIRNYSTFDKINKINKAFKATEDFRSNKERSDITKFVKAFKNEPLQRGAQFSISTEQLKKIEAWTNKKTQVYTGAIGGRFTYMFTPTSLGIAIKVIDNMDKTELDLTNYLGW